MPRSKGERAIISEDDGFDYQLENDPRFLARVERARKSLRAGQGVRLVALLSMSLLACSGPDPGDGSAPPEDEAAWRAEIQEWQAERQAGTSDPEGWRALVGLDWLEPGETTVGRAEDNDVVLPTDNARPHLGTFTVEEPAEGSSAKEGSSANEAAPAEPTAPEVRFRPAEGVEVTAHGEPVSDEIPLATDLEDDTTVLEAGSLALHVIAREEDDEIRLAVRSRDREHPRLEDPPQLAFYPLDPHWRFEARFEPYEPPRPNRIVNVLGMVSWEPLVGALVFQKNGVEHRLDVLESGDELFVIFGDATNGDTTYDSGRYLYTAKPVEEPAEGAPQGGDTGASEADEGDPDEGDPGEGDPEEDAGDEPDTVILDFNRAYNPPCAFTDFATCPVPPPQNRLPVAVTAGARYEKGYGGHESGGHEKRHDAEPDRGPG